MQGIKVGDTVMINAGGPAMTVISVDDKQESVACSWFCGNQKCNDTFPKKTIRPAQKYELLIDA